MKQFVHRGEVRGVEPGVVHVAIVAGSACHSCRARELCGMSESREKIVDVVTSEAERYAVGDEVLVAEAWRVGARALVLGYVGALVVLLVLLVGATLAGLTEDWAALLSLLGVGLYYLVLRLCRNKIERKIDFTITKS